MKVHEYLLSVVRVTYVVRDHERNIKRSLTKTIPLTADHEISYVTSHDSSEIKAFATSPSKSRSSGNPARGNQWIKYKTICRGLDRCSDGGILRCDKIS